MKTMTMVLAGALLMAAPAVAQLKYVDGAGVTHYVQSVDQIPAQYRAPTRPPYTDVTNEIERVPVTGTGNGASGKRFLNETHERAKLLNEIEANRKTLAECDKVRNRLRDENLRMATADQAVCDETAARLRGR